MSEDWPEDDTQLPALSRVSSDLAELKDQLVEFDYAWRTLSDRQRKFLETMQMCSFNERKTARILSDTTQTYRRWKANPQYALCLTVLRKNAALDVLNRERLIMRHDELVESMMTPKAVFSQGVPLIDPDTGQVVREIEAGAAAKANRDLMEFGGHSQPAQAAGGMVGPALIVQVTTKTGEVVSTTTVGVAPVLPVPEDEWLSTP